jgi:hypothetical protein
MPGAMPRRASGNGLSPTDAAGFFLAGDVRVNENVEPTSIQTLFAREHNRLADQIARNNPALTDEPIYQRARALVGAEIQVITYKQWLPALLGPSSLPSYAGSGRRATSGCGSWCRTGSR